MDRRKQLTKGRLQKMYIREKMSISAIAEEFGVSWGVARSRMRDCGVEVSRTNCRARPIPRMVLRQMYVTRKMTIKEIAEEVGIPWTNIRKMMIHHGIKRRSTKDLRFRITKVKLKELYCQKKMSLDDIGRELGVSDRIVRDRMIECGIERRPRNTPKAIIQKKQLKEMYCAQEKSMRAISEELGMSAGAVLRNMKEHGIDRRPKQQNLLIPKKTLLRMYCKQMKTVAAIAKEFAVSKATIQSRMVEYGIKRRNAGNQRITPLPPGKISRVEIKPSEIDNYRLSY